jgi:hypothetical protein
MTWPIFDCLFHRFSAFPDRFCHVPPVACTQAQGKAREVVLTDEFLRVMISDREREIQQRIRVRRLIGPRHPTIRWRSGRKQVGRPDAHEG